MNAYSEFRIGWPIVLSSMLGIAFGMSPLPFYTIGVFAGPLAAEFGWGIDKVFSGLAVFTLAAMIASPLVGSLSDRLGVRRVALTSIFLFSLSFMAFALNTGSLPLYYCLWALLAFCGAGTLPMTFTRAISNWFHEKRGLALGVALIGTGVSGALSKLFAAYVMAEAGWRVAYVAVGALPLLIALPIGLLFFRDINDPKSADRAERLRQVHSDGNVTTEVYGLTLPQALRDWRFWLLALVFVPLSFAIGGPIPNIETLLGAKGFSTIDAVFLASCLGYAVFGGRLLGGFLLDHIWAPLVACVLLIMPAISMHLLSADELSYSTTLISVILLGVAAGMEYDLLAYLVSRYFGIRSYAGIYGALYAFFALGAGFGPAVFGRAYEATGSYNAALNWSMWAFIFCSLALLLLGPYRDDKLRAMVD
ncbi:major facilitator superfamily protein [gamma proteobacterium NOR5-3]|nr:major facilitator superfamily protein [gamma proteobacterium NOR5-3]